MWSTCHAHTAPTFGVGALERILSDFGVTLFGDIKTNNTERSMSHPHTWMWLGVLVCTNLHLSEVCTVA